MPHPAKRVSLEREARAGEHKVAIHNSESARQFQALLKKPGKAENAQVSQAQGSVPGVPPVAQTEQEEYADLLERPRLIVSPTAGVIRISEPAEESMICFLDPLHQARFSDYNQRMRGH